MNRNRQQLKSRRGFTLIEALMAAGILLIIVFAVSSAVTAGQQQSFEAHKRIAAVLAAEELMGRLATVEYDQLKPVVHTEAVGEMTDGNHQPFPDSFAPIGRAVRITNATQKVGGVNVIGRTIEIRAFDEDDRTLASLTRFVPQPASETVEGEGEDEDEDEGGGGLLDWLLG